MRVYGPLAKPQKRRTGHNPVTGRLEDLDTGAPIIDPSSVPAQAVQVLVSYVSDPANTAEEKRIAMKNFERRFRVPASTFLQGGN